MKKLNPFQKLTTSQKINFYAVMVVGISVSIAVWAYPPQMNSVSSIRVVGNWLYEQKQAQMADRKQRCEEYKKNTPESLQPERVKNFSCDSYVLSMVKRK